MQFHRMKTSTPIFKWKRVVLFLILGNLSSYGMPTPHWELNDVTYILPLEIALHHPLALKGPEFIPPYSDLLQGRFVNETPEAYAQLRLVAFRIDPCFQEKSTDPCQHQIRAVWQPLTEIQGTHGNQIRATDAAVHTFFTFHSDEFNRIVQALYTLKVKAKLKTARKPIQIHPGFQNPLFTQELLQDLHRWLDPNQLSRVAF